MTIPPPIDPRRHALFLDFDGTLAELVDDPAAVRVGSDLVELLARRQHELGGALAIVSGRRVADLDGFLRPLGFAAAGVHGLERRGRANGPVEELASAATLQPARAHLTEALASAPGLRLEDKGTALVLHYRGAPERASEAERLMAEAASRLPVETALMRGKDIVELHPAGMDKGRAIADLMLAEPFAGRVPIYLGDDTTDEFAFAEVNRLNGVSVKVGSGDTAAAHHLADVGSVHRWLALDEAR